MSLVKRALKLLQGTGIPSHTAVPRFFFGKTAATPYAGKDVRILTFPHIYGMLYTIRERSFAKMKKLIAVFLCALCVFAMTSCTTVRVIEPFVLGITNDAIQKYEYKREKVECADEFLPTLASLGEYERIRYSSQDTGSIFFESNAIALFVEYAPSIYEQRKAEVLSSYEFLQETVVSNSGSYYCSPPAKFEYRSYIFQTTVKTDVVSYYDSYCKSFAFIGVNDAACRMAYLYFYDFDLDSMGSTDETEQEMITEFIDKYFYWNDIKA